MGLWLVTCKALCGGSSGGGSAMTLLWKVLEDAAGGGEEETPEDKRPVMPGRPWWVVLPQISPDHCSHLSEPHFCVCGKGSGDHFAPSPLFGGKSDVGWGGAFI